MAANTIKLSDQLETRIRDALAPLHPEKVILFGSYAWGQPTEVHRQLAIEAAEEDVSLNRLVSTKLSS